MDEFIFIKILRPTFAEGRIVGHDEILEVEAKNQGTQLLLASGKAIVVNGDGTPIEAERTKAQQRDPKPKRTR